MHVTNIDHSEDYIGYQLNDVDDLSHAPGRVRKIAAAEPRQRVRNPTNDLHWMPARNDARRGSHDIASHIAQAVSMLGVWSDPVWISDDPEN